LKTKLELPMSSQNVGTEWFKEKPEMAKGDKSNPEMACDPTKSKADENPRPQQTS
jgi:hypothetical protein